MSLSPTQTRIARAYKSNPHTLAPGRAELSISVEIRGNVLAGFYETKAFVSYV